MSRRALIRQADVRRQMKGAIQAAQEMGWPQGTYKVELVDGSVRLLPIAANSPSDGAADAERRMREAFGE